MSSADYFERLSEAISSVDHGAIKAIVEVLGKVRSKNNTVFLLGNGGSTSIASHWACDLNKAGICRALALTDDLPRLLAIANDIGFDEIFVEQLKTHAESGDIVIGISGSGKSSNVLRAVGYAKFLGCTTLGVCGFDGGDLKSMVDICFHVRINDMQIVEDTFLAVGHAIVRVLSSI